MRKEAEKVYARMTSYANYSEMNGISREWFIKCIEEGLSEAGSKVKNISSNAVLADSCRCIRCNTPHEECLKDKMCYTCDNVTEGNFR